MLYVDPVLRTRAGFDFASILKPENRTNAKPEPFVLPRLFSSSRTLICSYPQSCLCVNMVVGRTGVLAILILVMLVELLKEQKPHRHGDWTELEVERTWGSDAMVHVMHGT